MTKATEDKEPMKESEARVEAEILKIESEARVEAEILKEELASKERLLKHA